MGGKIVKKELSNNEIQLAKQFNLSNKPIINLNYLDKEVKEAVKNSAKSKNMKIKPVYLKNGKLR